MTYISSVACNIKYKCISNGKEDHIMNYLKVYIIIQSSHMHCESMENFMGLLKCESIPV